jgi:hypothetical protein
MNDDMTTSSRGRQWVARPSTASCRRRSAPLRMRAGALTAVVAFFAGAGPVMAAPTIDPIVGAKPFKPVVTINSPSSGATYYSVEGTKANISYDGVAKDPQDGTVPGERLRWEAKANFKGSVHQVSLCRGSSWPGKGDTDKLQVRRDCSEFSSDKLYGFPYPGATWKITLSAVDFHGNVSSATTSVTVKHVVS